MPTPENLISIREAARLKDCARQTIYNALNRGDLNGLHAGGFRLVYRDQTFEEWQVQAKYRPHKDNDEGAE